MCERPPLPEAPTLVDTVFLSYTYRPQQAEVVIGVFGPGDPSPHVVTELARAHDRQKPIAALVVPEVDAHARFPGMYRLEWDGKSLDVSALMDGLAKTLHHGDR